MKRHIRLIPVLLLLLHTSLYGQVPVIQWQKTLGSSHGDYPGSIRLTADGGYIVAGYTEGADGDVVGYHGNIRQTPDGGYIVAGSSSSIDCGTPGKADSLRKRAPMHILLWEKTSRDQ